MPQSYITDYPILAYNSFTSDNSEIVIANLGIKGDNQCIVNLGNWSFLSFVNFPKSMKIREFNTNPLLSHICMLVRHK